MYGNSSTSSSMYLNSLDRNHFLVGYKLESTRIRLICALKEFGDCDSWSCAAFFLAGDSSAVCAFWSISIIGCAVSLFGTRVYIERLSCVDFVCTYIHMYKITVSYEMTWTLPCDTPDVGVVDITVYKWLQEELRVVCSRLWCSSTLSGPQPNHTDWLQRSHRQN
jgi:hypothetical protein